VVNTRIFYMWPILLTLFAPHPRPCPGVWHRGPSIYCMWATVSCVWKGNTDSRYTHYFFSLCLSVRVRCGCLHFPNPQTDRNLLLVARLRAIADSPLSCAPHIP
jgi:hypothetical protein